MDQIRSGRLCGFDWMGKLALSTSSGRKYGDLFYFPAKPRPDLRADQESAKRQAALRIQGKGSPVTIKKRPMAADGSSAERRRGPRFPVVVPLEVSWVGKDGIAVKEDAVARQVNANGGFLKMANYPSLGNRVTLTNFLS